MLTPPVTRATLALGDEKLARRVADVLTETFDSEEVAVAAFEVSEALKTHKLSTV